MKNLCCWVLALSALSFGCEIDDEENRESESEIDESRLLASLTNDEAEDICEFRMASQNNADSQKFSCYTVAVFTLDIDPNADCEMGAQECIDEPDASQEDCSNADVYGIPEGCTATVGELQTCYEDFDLLYSMLADGLSCENFYQKTENAPGEPESCVILEQKCPGLISDE